MDVEKRTTIVAGMNAEPMKQGLREIATEAQKTTTQLTQDAAAMGRSLLDSTKGFDALQRKWVDGYKDAMTYVQALQTLTNAQKNGRDSLGSYQTILNEINRSFGVTGTAALDAGNKMLTAGKDVAQYKEGLQELITTMRQVTQASTATQASIDATSQRMRSQTQVNQFAGVRPNYQNQAQRQRDLEAAFGPVLQQEADQDRRAAMSAYLARNRVGMPSQFGVQAAPTAAEHAARQGDLQDAFGTQMQQRMDAARSKYDDVFRASKQYEKALNELNAEHQRGDIDQKTYGTGLDRLNQQFAAHGQALHQMAGGTGQEQFAMRQLGVQAIQTFQGFATGQPILMTLIQQGHQVLDVMLSAGVSFSKLGSAIGSTFSTLWSWMQRNPFSLFVAGAAAAAAAIAALIVSSERFTSRMLEQQNVLRGVGTDFVARQQMGEAAARHLAATTPLGYSEASAAMAQITANPAFQGTQMQGERLVKLAHEVSVGMGTTLPDALKLVVRGFDDASGAAQQFVDKGLGQSQGLTQAWVDSLKLMNRPDAFAALSDMLGRVFRGGVDNVSYLTAAWRRFTENLSADHSIIRGIGTAFAYALGGALNLVNLLLEGFQKLRDYTPNLPESIRQHRLVIGNVRAPGDTPGTGVGETDAGKIAEAAKLSGQALQRQIDENRAAQMVVTVGALAADRQAAAAMGRGDAAGFEANTKAAAEYRETLLSLQGAATDLITPQQQLARSLTDTLKPLQAQAGAARDLAEIQNQFALAARKAPTPNVVDQQAQAAALAARQLQLTTQANDEVEALNRQTAAQQAQTAAIGQGGVAMDHATNLAQAQIDVLRTAQQTDEEYTRQVRLRTAALDADSAAKRANTAATSTDTMRNEIELLRIETAMVNADAGARAAALAVERQRQQLKLLPGQTANAGEQAAIDAAADVSRAKDRLAVTQAIEEAKIRASFAARIAAAEADGADAVTKLTMEMETLIARTKSVADYATAGVRAWEAQSKAIGELVAKLRDLNLENQKSAQLTEAKLRGPAAYGEELVRQKTDELLRGSPLQRAAPQLPNMPALPGAYPGALPAGTTSGGIPTISVGGVTAVPVSVVGGGAVPGGAAAAPGAGGLSLSSISGGGLSASVAKDAAARFQGLLDDLTAAGVQIKSLGGYANRNIAGTNTPSLHASGQAIDINASTNQQGLNLPSDMPPALATALANKWGLTWGGNWTGATRDPMHFEIHGAMAQTGAGGAPGATPNAMTPEIAKAFEDNARRTAQASIFEPVRARLADEALAGQEQARIQQAAAEAIGRTNAQQQKAIELTQRQIQLEKDLELARTDDAKAFVLANDQVLRQQIEQRAKLGDSTERAKAAFSEVENFADRAFSTVGDAITGSFQKGADAGEIWKNAMTSILNDVMKEFIKLAIINPLKNALFNSNNPTDADLGGVFGKLFGGNSSSGKGSGGGIGGGGTSDIFGKAINSIMGKGFFEGGGLFGSLFGGGGGFGAAGSMPFGMGSGGLSAGADGSLYGSGGIFHQGGVVGLDAVPSRLMPSNAFALAPHLQRGFANDEFAAVLHRSERVLTANQNNRLESVLGRVASGDHGGRGGGGGGGPAVVMNISTPDADSFRSSQHQINTRAVAALNRSQQRSRT